MAGRVRLRTWLVGGGAFVGLGTLSFLYHYLDDRANGILGTAKLRAMTEYTGALAGAVIFVAVVLLVRRYPLIGAGPSAAQPRVLRRRGWRGPLAIYVAAMPVLGAVNTTLILLLRDWIAPLIGLAGYSYGDLWFRYPMEFSYQIIIYAMMITGLLLADAYRENERRERDLARAELENLRLQLQPHFLFNALNTISAVMYEDVAHADAMVQRLSELLRRALAGGEQQEVPLGEELAAARLYMELQQARFEEQLRVEFDIGVGAEGALVPHFVLQPLLENAMHHGGGTITVRAVCGEQSLALEVCDSGRQGGAAGDGHGIGLRNTGERLARLYGQDQQFEYGPMTDGGFRARMRVPLRA